MCFTNRAMLLFKKPSRNLFYFCVPIRADNNHVWSIRCNFKCDVFWSRVAAMIYELIKVTFLKTETFKKNKVLPFLFDNDHLQDSDVFGQVQKPASLEWMPLRRLFCVHLQFLSIWYGEIAKIIRFSSRKSWGISHNTFVIVITAIPLVTENVPIE